MARFHGSIPALITPFAPGGELDEDAYDRLIDRQIAAGTHGLVPVGTTGESPTLSHDEHMRVVARCIRRTAGRVPIIAGAGSNSTREAIEFAQHAEAAGADAVLVVAPYYNKPTQAGLAAHYTAIADAIGIPVFIYNVPSRVVVDVGVATLARLSQHPRIAGVKDATANIARVSQQRAACAPGFIQLSGEDATALGFNAHGGHGCIGVTANIAPELCAQMHDACAAGDYARALVLQDRLMPLHDALFCETNPGPVKYAAELLGLCSAATRLPLVPISETSRRAVEDAVERVGLAPPARLRATA